ncbi:MAG: hypothetical protein MI924_17655 [Chloroflexales bacterium]|nr:hypothetical protein [Chloroflexales bacterium]
MNGHAAVAVINMDEATVQAVLDDWRTAPVSPRLRAALALLETLTLRPQELSAADIEAARRAGLSDQAIEEAMYVCFLFSIMDRLADAFDFEVQPMGANKWKAHLMNLVGYRLF